MESGRQQPVERILRLAFALENTHRLLALCRDASEGSRFGTLVGIAIRSAVD